MNNPLQDERISAYLDGELTDEERISLEHELAGDPERRQLLDEMRALSAALGGLDKQALGDQFQQQVMRQAERTVLTQTASAVAPGPSADVEHTPVETRKELPIGYSRRGWAWACAAVAAALLLMIFQHEFDPEATKVAMHEPGESAIGAAEEADASLEAPAAGFGDDAAAEQPRSLASKGGAGPVDSESSFDLADAPMANQPAKGGVALPDFARDADDRESADTEIALHGKLDSALTAKTDRGLDGQDKNAAGVARSNARLKEEVPRATSQVMVVHVDMRPEAAARSRLNRLLLTNGIVCATDAKYGLPTDAEAGTGGWYGQQPIAKKRASTADRSRAAGVQGRGAGGGGRFGDGGLDEGDAQQASEDVVFVEASYDQVAQTLEQLNDDLENFVAIEVDAAPDVPAQQMLVQNSRGRTSNYWTAGDRNAAAANAAEEWATVAPQTNLDVAKDAPRSAAQRMVDAIADEKSVTREADPDAAAGKEAGDSVDQQQQVKGFTFKNEGRDQNAAHRLSTVPQLAEADGDVLTKQLQEVFDDAMNKDTDDDTPARAMRVPEPQRQVAEQIVAANRFYNSQLEQRESKTGDAGRFRGSQRELGHAESAQQLTSQRANPLRRRDRPGSGGEKEIAGARGRQQAAPVDVPTRDGDRIYVLFVLNVVDAPADETAKTAPIDEAESAEQSDLETIDNGDSDDP